MRLFRRILFAALVGSVAIIGCGDDETATGGNGGTGGTGGNGGGGEGGIGGAAVIQVFVTSGAFDGNLGGLDGADDICTNAAAEATPSLGGTWTAWLSDNSTDAIDRIADGEYQLLDGTVVANDKVDLTDGSLDAAINLDEKGGTVGDASDAAVWTATNEEGINPGVGSCEEWTLDMAGGGGAGGAPERGRIGDSRLTTGDWTDQGGGQPCDFTNRLYCFSDG